MWVVISSYSIPAARIRFRWSSHRMQKGSALITRSAIHLFTAAQLLQLLFWSAGMLMEPGMQLATLLSDATNTLHMLTEKSHVCCDFLIQHSCCKNPFSMVITSHVEGTRRPQHQGTTA